MCLTNRFPIIFRAQSMRKIAFLVVIFLLCSCKESPPRYNGYIEADLTYLSSNFPGKLAELVVRRGEAVQKNQLLFKLEQTNEYYAVAISESTKKNLLSQRNEIISQIQYAETNYRRTQKMKGNDVASQNDLDVAKKDLDVLNEQLKAIDFQIKSSQADIALKNWQVERKESHATDNGIIFDTYFTKGEYVQAGQPVLALITKPNIKVIFFVPENQLSKVLLNAKINISSDGTQQPMAGTIRYIANRAQYTSPLIFSREERKNLVFRVEAGIDSPDLDKIHLGQPVSLDVVG